MRRFIIERKQIEDRKATITGSEARHMVQVLRLRIGDSVELVDDRGTGYAAAVDSIAVGRVTLSLGMPNRTSGESPIRITLAQALLKDRKMDTLIRQLTELGVTRWIPFTAERSVPRPGSGRLSNRMARWEKIAREALKQCRRNHPPAIGPPVSYTEALHGAATSDLKVVFWEKAQIPLSETVAASGRVESVFLLMGPEGGFTDREIEAAGSCGFSAASLGPRILRAETATVAACALVQHLFGDLGA